MSEVDCSATRGLRTKGREEILQLRHEKPRGMLSMPCAWGTSQGSLDTAVLEFCHLLGFHRPSCRHRVLTVMWEVRTPGCKEEGLTLFSEKMTSSSLERQLHRVAPHLE